MLNLTSRKVLIPSALFALLSFVKTSKNGIFLYATLFVIVYRFLAYLLGMVLQPADLIVPSLLFILSAYTIKNNNLHSILIHTAVFVLVFAFLRKQFPKYY